MIRKTILGAVLVAAFALFFAGPASAQYEPQVEPETEVQVEGVDTSVEPAGTAGAAGTRVLGASADTLPETGSSDSTATLAMVGAGLVVVGGMVVLGARRRQTSS